MASLTETSYYARKLVKFGVIGLVSLIILRSGWMQLAKWWKDKNPPPPPAPTTAFGVLPQPKFPKSREVKPELIKLETVSGSTPDLGIQAKVYFMPAFRANVYGLELSTGLAKKLGFKENPIKIDEQVYEWERMGDLPGKLTVNLVTGHFSLMTNWSQDPEFFSAKLPAEASAVISAQNYLRSAGLWAEDLASGSTKAEYVKAEEEGLKPAISQSEANFTRIHFFRAKIGDKPVVTWDQSQALIQMTVGGGMGTKQIVEVKYKYSPVEIKKFETYPIKTALEAWQLLQSGKGNIAQAVENGQNIVRTIDLVYYDSDTPQEFMQPVYKFSGDNGFVGYVSAVQDKWLAQ